MKHFILDYETFGQDVTSCAVIDCSYFTFDTDIFLSDNPYTFKHLCNHIEYDKLNVTEQVKQYGYKIESNTVDWWSKQGVEVQKRIGGRKSDISLNDYISGLSSYLAATGGTNIKYWWSRGNTFDPIILSRILKDVTTPNSIHQYLKYWAVRDVRTFMDAAFDFDLKDNNFPPFEDVAKWEAVYEKHNSVHDVAGDIMRFQVIARMKNGLGSINE